VLVAAVPVADAALEGVGTGTIGSVDVVATGGVMVASATVSATLTALAASPSLSLTPSKLFSCSDCFASHAQRFNEFRSRTTHPNQERAAFA
jgi:ABC-type uncharacterized transport system permease subunit